MSRIGKKPVAMPSGVSASVEGQTLTVKGPKGTLSMQLLDDLVKYEVGEGEIRLTPLVDAQRNNAAWGMTRTNVQNLVTGVTEGFTKVLEITGVGYRAQAQGKNLRLQLGIAIRQFAKEQITWFKRDRRIVWLDPFRDYYQEACERIRQWRDEPRLSDPLGFQGSLPCRRCRPPPGCWGWEGSSRSRPAC